MQAFCDVGTTATDGVAKSVGMALDNACRLTNRAKAGNNSGLDLNPFLFFNGSVVNSHNATLWCRNMTVKRFF